jgi:ATP-dependent Clp protease ATP-binding subunit ClpA
VHVSVKDDKLAFELAPAPPKVKPKRKKKAAAKKTAPDKPDAADAEGKSED